MQPQRAMITLIAIVTLWSFWPSLILIVSFGLVLVAGA